LRVEGRASWRAGPDPEKTYLFVYGSLRRGGEFHHYLAGARFAGPAWTRGRIIQAGAYPGLVEGDGRVEGELYELADPAADLERLDDVEGFVPEDAAGSLYLRELRPVYREDGTRVASWVYLWNADAMPQ
jgi:gamma-glutamylcyclotransferase (GGCT)/AIG2-like uncharacterized protein YtfP